MCDAKNGLIEVCYESAIDYGNDHEFDQNPDHEFRLEWDPFEIDY